LPDANPAGDAVNRKLKLIVAVLVGAVLAAVATAWFLHNYEKTEYTRRERPGREALRNPWLALERFMTRMDRSFTIRHDSRALDALPSPGVLILDRDRTRYVSEERAQSIMQWVEEGGYLIVIPESRFVADPIVGGLGLCWVTSDWITRVWKNPDAADADAEADDCSDDDEDWDEDEDDQDDAVVPGKAPSPKLPPAPEHTQVNIPGVPRGFDVEFSWGMRTFTPEDDRPTLEWRADAPPYGSNLIHFAVGYGNVTVVTRLSALLSNYEIGERDHADLFWTLLSRYQPSGPVLFVTRVEMLSLWEWLAESAWMVLVSAACLIGLWLLRVVPRFGVTRPAPAASPRELREHLGAVGRFVWRAGGMAQWLAIARRAFRARLALRLPEVAALPPAAQTRALAKLSARPLASVMLALDGDVRTPSQFTEALRVLQRLERSL
jgi:hypothetical protein